jgi:hypothetical protein
MNKAVFGIATSDSQAASIAEKWKAAGIADENISVLFPDTNGNLQVADDPHTKAPEGAALGGGGGLIIGGALGWLVGIGALAIPGAGPLIAAGPLLAALAGAGVGAATGGVAGTLIGFGIPEHAAVQYEGRIKEGNILLSVHTTDSLQRDSAKQLLIEGGAEDISYSDEADK